MPKENTHNPEKVIKNDEKVKFIHKDLLDRFEPLTEEEQKDLLFILLDCLDFYAEKMDGAKNEADKQRFYEHYSTYQFFISFLMKDPDWMKGIGAHKKRFLLNCAHGDRLEWEESKKENKA